MNTKTQIIEAKQKYTDDLDIVSSQYRKGLITIRELVEKQHALMLEFEGFLFDFVINDWID